MKQKAILKDTFREIKKSMGRFLSIFAIVAIGVAFFAGVRASAPIMKYNADKYYDDYNLMDLKVMSTLGLTSTDIDELKKIDGVEGVYASHSMDVLNKAGTQQTVLKAVSIPLEADQNNNNYINQARIVEGRLPQNDNECVLEYDKIKKSVSGNNKSIALNDEITLTSGKDTPIENDLKNTKYKVVGFVNTPYYLSYEKGSSLIGSGKIDGFVLIGEKNFKSSIYSEAYITLKGVKQLNTYNDQYFEVVEKNTKKFTSLGEVRAKIRYDEIKVDADTKLNENIVLYNTNKDTFTNSIQNAKDEINRNEQDLIENEKKWQEGYRLFNNSKNEWDTTLPTLKVQLDALNNKLSGLKQQIGQLTLALSNPNLSSEERAILLAQLEALKGGVIEIENGIYMINNTIATTPPLLNSKEIELNNAKAQIDAGKVSLEGAKATLQTKEKEGQSQLDEAKLKLDKAHSDIDSIKEGSWYVLDRHSHYSYMDYGSAADRMGAIAKVFPLFFFLVAALVCLTTMTRMVDEQRQEIGTLKALGYPKFSIAFKFIAYASIASISGGIFGALLGMIVFPAVIFNAWGLMYSLPEVTIQIDLSLASLAIALAVAITTSSAIMACYKELIEEPSLLMRPKAPKNGKKIFLERINFLWKHLSFTQKVTARNIFRYKKRFFMTIIGISGCSALLVAGYGIQDSIGQVATKQYGEIYKYDVSLTFEEDLAPTQQALLYEQLKQEKEVKEAMTISLYHGLYADKGEDKGVDITVVENTKMAKLFYTFKNRKSNEVLTLGNTGALISEKLAKDKNLTVGDSFKVDNGDGFKKKIKISGIMENYIGHSIYMSPTYYKKVYHQQPIDSSIIAILKHKDTTSEQTLGNSFTKKEGITSVVFYSNIANNFSDTIASLNIIVLVLIISAGLLAFVVLYNLTNVNISERLREIATIKVLGFYDKEVSSYVYRENIILTLIGAFVGLLLGIALHGLIMNLAELDTVMFGRNIEPFSFIISIVITMLFSIFVNLVMYRKLKRIPMVESLKSIE